jgi:hypothetical protein
VALKNDGSVVAWGNNGLGQTTVPVAAQSGVTAITAGGYHTVALLGTAVSLKVRSNSHGVVLSWATNSMGFTLQSTFNLIPPVEWLDVTNAPTLAGAHFTVTNLLSNGAVFYRLRKP